MYNATTQSNLRIRTDNVLWDQHEGEPRLCIDRAKVQWSQWNKLYAALINRIQTKLEALTFLTPLDLPQPDIYMENRNDSRPGVNFATTLPKKYQNIRDQLLKHVLTPGDLRDKWVLSGSGPQVKWNQVVAEEWMSMVDKLAGDLCLLGFLASGPSARGKEWVAMLAMNDQNSNRSVYWTIKGLCFMYGYNKVCCVLSACSPLIFLCR